MSIRSLWRSRFVGLAALVGCGVLTWRCATNPVSGKSQLSLYSEAEEIEMGRAEDRKTQDEIGLYGGEALQAYVQQLGLRLAAGSERPGLPWSFRVVDDSSVNAFALPGGFVYVTRGILTHLTSEAELATVIGHEIGHVTARHSVSQMSKAELTMIGVGVAAAATGSDEVGGLAAAGAQLLFAKFSRHDESQADSLGVRYALRAGFDPRPMADVMSMLDRVSGSPGGRLPNWLASHPAPENRRQAIERDIAALKQDFSGATVDRDAFLTRLRGMEFGDDPREGFFEDTRFYHPNLKFQMRFPSGWKSANEKTEVGAASPGQDAMVVLSLAKADSPGAAAKEFLDQQGLESTGDWRADVNGLPASSGYFRADTEKGSLQGLAAFVSLGGQVYRLLGYGTQTGWRDQRAALEASLASFSRLTDPAKLAVQPKRIELVRLPRAMSLVDFALAYPSSVSVETLALINQVSADALLPEHQLMKRVVGGVLDKY